jgi:hypothetical protein
VGDWTTQISLKLLKKLDFWHNGFVRVLSQFLFAVERVHKGFFRRHRIGERDAFGIVLGQSALRHFLGRDHLEVFLVADLLARVDRHA